MTLKLFNPRYNADGTIDCEWDHPVHGVIPFTASPHDVEEHGRAMFEWLARGDFGPVAPYVPDEDEPTNSAQD